MVGRYASRRTAHFLLKICDPITEDAAYTVGEVPAMAGFFRDTITPMFEREPGVGVFMPAQADLLTPDCARIGIDLPLSCFPGTRFLVPRK